MAIIVLSLGAFWWNREDIVKDIVLLRGQGSGISFIPLIEVLVPAFLVVWILRIVAKFLNSHIAQMHDASERAVMTQTFIAMMQKEMATPEDRILILHSLFRPSPGTFIDDGAPPSWFDLLLNKIKPGS